MSFKQLSSGYANGLANGVTLVEVTSDVSIGLPAMVDGYFATFVLKRATDAEAAVVTFPSMAYPGNVPPDLPTTSGSVLVWQVCKAVSHYEVSRSRYDAGA